jgi:hypothetical protein
MAHRRFMSRFVVVIGIAALLATLLHRIEAANWAAAYRFPGALPDNKSATESGKYGLHIYPSFLIGPLGSTSSRIKGAHDPVHPLVPWLERGLRPLIRQESMRDRGSLIDLGS